MGNTVSVVRLRPFASAREEFEGITVYGINKNMAERTVLEFIGFNMGVFEAFHLVKDAPQLVIDSCRQGYLYVNQLSAERVKEVYCTTRFDIIHVHDFQFLPLASLLQDIACPKILTWHIPFKGRVQPDLMNFAIDCMNYYDRVIFTTEESAKIALRCGLSEGKGLQIPPTIIVTPCLDHFREKYGIPCDSKIALCVGRVDPLKGQDLLLEALPQVLKTVPNLTCIFIGNGWEEIGEEKKRLEFKQKLRQMVEVLNLHSHVIFTGYISRSDLMCGYASCNVVILPSLEEAFGVTVCEGMALGKPVVGSAVGGIKEQIKHGETGLLVEPRNPQQLAEAVVKVLSNDELAETLASEGKKRYESNYAPAISINSHIDVYRDAIRKTAHSRKGNTETTA